MPQNPFDGMSKRVFGAVEATMGYDGSWSPSDLSPIQETRVLFGKPTKEDKLGDYGDSFTPLTSFMEWYEGSFVGLHESVDDSGEEYVIIDGESYYVVYVEAKYDGKNYRAQIEKRPLPDGYNLGFSDGFGND